MQCKVQLIRREEEYMRICIFSAIYIYIYIPCSQGSRKWKNRGGYGDRPDRYWWHLYQAWAVDAHSRIQFLHCLLCKSGPHLCPHISESPIPLSHRGMMIFLSTIINRNQFICLPNWKITNLNQNVQKSLPVLITEN